MIVLPKEKLKARIENPRFLILFGKPKSGKTTLASKLDNNLIVDLEGGSEFLEALAIQARSVNDLGEIANAIREEIKKEACFSFVYGKRPVLRIEYEGGPAPSYIPRVLDQFF